MISYIYVKLCLDICKTSVEVKLEFYYPLNMGLKLVTLCLLESPNRSEWRTVVGLFGYIELGCLLRYWAQIF